jgi:uncharacterized protein YbbK (DUF523 family)
MALKKMVRNDAQKSLRLVNSVMVNEFQVRRRAPSCGLFIAQVHSVVIHPPVKSVRPEARA